jgi:Cu+-exporting ATPase
MLFIVHTGSRSLTKGKFSIRGMTCSSCVGTVERCLASLAGIKSVSVNLLAECADIDFDSDIIKDDAIIEAIEDIGYDASLLTKFAVRASGNEDAKLSSITLLITGMSCSSCVNRIETTIKEMKGVASISVNFATGRAQVEFNEAIISVSDIVCGIEDLGYLAEKVNKRMTHKDIREARAKEIASWRNLLIFSALFAIPVLIVHMVLMKIPSVEHKLMQTVYNELTIDHVIQFLLSTPVQFIAGKRFYVSAYKGLRHCSMGMDFLIVFGTSVAYFYSVAVIIIAMTTKPTSVVVTTPMSDHNNMPGHNMPTVASSTTAMPEALFFETSAVLIMFVILGKYLEAQAKGKTGSALEKLIEMSPSVAIKLQLDEETGAVVSEKEIKVDFVSPGDILKVLPGAKFPVDGVITKGTTMIDESMITGESMPVTKKEGDIVIGSTINSLNNVHIKATKIGEDTTLAQIIQLVEQAQVSKAPIQVSFSMP